MKLIVVVQILHIEWGKEARGGALATRRVQTLRRLESKLPFPKPATVAIVQRVQSTDWDSFEKAVERVYEYETLTSANPPELYLDLKAQCLHVQAHSPHPSGRDKPIFLNVNETAQFEWNERLIYEDVWRYSQTRVNVALAEKPLGARMFQKPFTYSVSNLSQMY